MRYLKKCVTSLDKSRKSYTSQELNFFHRALKDEHSLMMLETDTNLDILSLQEQRDFQRRLNSKKMKISARYQSIQHHLNDLKELREFELQTRDLWNKVQLQIRLKILYSDARLESVMQTKYIALLNELNSLMTIIQTLPFFIEVCSSHACGGGK